jgi:hypothetical protein
MPSFSPPTKAQLLPSCTLRQQVNRHSVWFGRPKRKHRNGIPIAQQSEKIPAREGKPRRGSSLPRVRVEKRRPVIKAANIKWHEPVRGLTTMRTYCSQALKKSSRRMACVLARALRARGGTYFSDRAGCPARPTPRDCVATPRHRTEF